MNLRTNITAFVFVSVLTIGCHQKNTHSQGQQKIARVGSVYLTLGEANNNIAGFRERDSTYTIKAYRRQWIHRQLLLREARRLKINQQKNVQKLIQRAQQEVLIHALKKTITNKYRTKSTVSDSEALRYFKKNQAKLTLNERYVRYRLVETKKLGDARRARAMLRNDSSWIKVAKTYSLRAKEHINRSKEFWPISSSKNMIPGLLRDVASLDSGQFSPIRRSKGNYQFLEVTGIRQPGDTANSRWFIDQLKTWRMHEKQRNYYRSYVKNLYLSAKKNNEISTYNVK